MILQNKTAYSKNQIALTVENVINSDDVILKKYINSIYITSLQRPGDNPGSPHYKNLAVDISANPASLIPYIFSIIVKELDGKANIYLKKGDRELHIHVDIDNSNHGFMSAYENPDGKSLSTITEDNIRLVFKQYGLVDDVIQMAAMNNMSVLLKKKI